MIITEQFVDGLVKKSQNIPQSVLYQTRRCVLDYLGVTIGGMRYIVEKHPELIGVSPCDVFLHAFAAHVLELDDGNRHGMIHLGASIVSAVFDVAEKGNLKSEDLLRGIVMGYEVAVRCAKALKPGHKKRGYHVSGTCGTIGSALGIAFACGYNNLSNFNRLFKRKKGCSPTKFREEYKKINIEVKQSWINAISASVVIFK